jgi:DNA-binding Lrp family transcriptional regulator
MANYKKFWQMDVSPISKLILIYISENNSNNISYSDIAYGCNITRKTVINHVKKLCDQGLIIKNFTLDSNGASLPNSYSVV